MLRLSYTYLSICTVAIKACFSNVYLEMNKYLYVIDHDKAIDVLRLNHIQTTVIWSCSIIQYYVNTKDNNLTYASKQSDIRFGISAERVYQTCLTKSI